MNLCWQDMWILIGGLAGLVTIISSFVIFYRGIIQELHKVCDPIRQDAREAHARIDATIAEGRAQWEASNARIDATIAEGNARIDATIAQGNARIDQSLARIDQLHLQFNALLAAKK